MRISYPNGIVISLSKDEAMEIFYAVKHSIEDTIKTHWRLYPDRFLKDETRLRIIKELCRITKYSYEVEILPLFLDMLKSDKPEEIEKYCDRELQEMKELCVYMIRSFKQTAGNGISGEIYEIALVDINRELDVRAIKKEATGG